MQAGVRPRLLCIVSPVEVVARDAALGAGHVPTDDEMSASEVLADHHVLHRLKQHRVLARRGTARRG